MAVQSISLLFIFALCAPGVTEAADCETNCSSSCQTSWRYPCGIGKWCDKTIIDPACKVRCETERVLACNIGLNFCDLQRINQPELWEKIKIALQAAADAQILQSHNQCLDAVSGGGSIVSVADFFLELGLPPGSVALAKHFLHCICGEVVYENSSIIDGSIMTEEDYHNNIDMAIRYIYLEVYQRPPDEEELRRQREAFERGLSYVVIKAEVIREAIYDIYSELNGYSPAEADLKQGFADFEKGLSYVEVYAKTLTRRNALLLLLNQYVTSGF